MQIITPMVKTELTFFEWQAERGAVEERGKSRLSEARSQKKVKRKAAVLKFEIYFYIFQTLPIYSAMFQWCENVPTPNL